MACLILHLATRRGLPEIMQPLCSPKNGLYSFQDLGLQLERAGSVRRRGVVAQEEELGRGRVRCRVRREWDWELETRGFLCLGGNQGPPKGAEWVLEEDSPMCRWGPRSR